MTDSQWPIYVVFQQLRPDQPHVHAGAVHAPDAELALMHARDVFVRRPACYSLWVARASDILSRTKEQIAKIKALDSHRDQSDEQTYFIFQKLGHSGVITQVGQVRSHSAGGALQRALQELEDRSALVWWVIAASKITRSEPQDSASLFEPANHKTYRHQSDFKTLTFLRNLRAKRKGHEPRTS